jgi:gliding motility-associated-like protein
MKYFFALACTLLLFNSAFGQIILTQNQNDATIGLDRKAFNGLGNTSQSSDGYAHDFTLPESTSSCQRISGISVAINLTGYTNNSLPGCPPITLYYNLFYGCGTYSGGATCLPASNLIAQPNFAPNTSPPPFNFGNPLGSPLNATIVPDFGDNLSVDIIPVSNPGCNSVSNGRISYQYTITVTVSVEDVPDVSPTFTQVPAICEGDTLSDLPTTSSNGITGTWSPAPDNTVTTTYTFTPNSDPCATTQTMTITVNPADIEPTFIQVPAICEGEALSALPTTSNNSITGTWSPVINNTTTTEYTFTPNADQCATTQTMIITVNAATTPIFTQVQDICEGESLAALPTNSNNGIEGSWSPVINNTATTEYTFTPDTGQCATTQTMIITVIPAITPTFTQVPAICEGESLAALPTTSNNGIEGSWSPAPDNTATTTYTFTPNANQCATTQTMTITVNPADILPTFTQVAAICEGESLEALPTTSNNGITGIWSPAPDNTTTTEYTFTPNANQCASTQTMTIVIISNVTPLFSQVEPICFGETLTSLPTTSNNGITGTWSPALNSTATTEYTFTPAAGLCATTQTMTIIVNSNAAPVITEVLTTDFNIEIFTTQTGDFSYSIDGQNFQYSNIFYGIPGGVYTITVRDNFGCGEDVITHLHLVIPKFFTPNNDGFNDFFEIRGIQELGNSEVNIFDRYGKLLKSYKNSPVVWDGTYLGNLLPTNDYWYQIIFDGEEFRGHFTLKR